jgi:tetratricopeptide (TPR) repeat protein
MPLPSRVDVLRTSFTLGWLALALGTLSWKAPWFWTVVPQQALIAPPPAPAAPGTGDVEAVPETAAAPSSATRRSRVPVSIAPVAIADGSTPAAEVSARHQLLVAAARHEEAGRFDAAVQAYRFVAAMDGTLRAEEQLRLARALRWSGRLPDAIAAYESYLGSPTEASRAAVQSELGLALVDAGRFTEAWPHLEAATQADPGDEAVYLGIATAASELGYVDRAADALLTLAALRTLTPAEAMWLSGHAEAGGRIDAGLPAIYAALDAAPGAYDLWERAGDLEWTRSRYADAYHAYDHVPPDCRHARVMLKSARSAARAGHGEPSAHRYAATLDCDPSGPVLLEAARAHGSHGAAERALPYYAAYAASADPPADVWLEMATTALAAGRPSLALEWAEAGLARGGDAAPLAFARAQALQMLQRPREAEASLAVLARTEPRNGVWLAWLGRSAFAQGRHLAAFHLFSRALRTSLDDRPQILVEQGDAAAARGDLARARRSYLSARAAARNPEDYDVDARLEAIDDRTRPELRLPVERFRDANGVAVTQAAGELVLNTTDAVRLRARWTTGSIEQDDVRFIRRALAIRAEDVFVTPSFRVDLGVGVEDYGGEALPLWDVRLRRDFAGGGHLAVQALRQTPWSAETRLGTARYNRISDLGSLGTAFHATGVRGAAELPLPGRHALRVDGGWQRHSDANEQHDLYVHVQRELIASADGRTWMAIQPQAYYESWAVERPAYFSPGTHVGAGLGLRTQLTRAGWTLEGTATPQLLGTGGGRGFGFFGSAALARQVGPVWLGADATLFDDRRSRYRVHRLAAEVRVPLGP